MKKTTLDKYVYFYKGTTYPNYLKRGNAAKYIIPIAQEFCKGKGLDIGGKKDCHFPGAKIINIELGDGFNAEKLPEKEYDYIFSSHTLEHLTSPIRVLKYWRDNLKKHGVLFLYLPHYEMTYWRPENCKKHKHQITTMDIREKLNLAGYHVVMQSRRDSFWSFATAAIKI